MPAEPWQEEMNRRILGVLVARGGPVTEGNATWGWIAEDWRELVRHAKECGVDTAKSTWEDSEWDEFAGTFAEPPWQCRKGIDAVVTCNCGKVQQRRWRYTGSHAELLRAVTGG